MTIVREAVCGAVSAVTPLTVLTDGGVENANASVESLVNAGLFKRVLTLKEVTFSDSG